MKSIAGGFIQFGRRRSDYILLTWINFNKITDSISSYILHWIWLLIHAGIKVKGPRRLCAK